MRFDVITLFPELFAPFLTAGITRRAYASGQVDVHLWNPRDHAEGNYRRVDDRPFGGGPGMVMMAEPLERCLNHIREQRGEALDTQAPLVLFSPIGRKLNHAEVEGWSASAGAILLCGPTKGWTSDSSMRMSPCSRAWAILCCRVAKLRRWRCWMPWPACSQGC